VRELRHEIERLVVLSGEDGEIESSQLSPHIAAGGNGKLALDADAPPPAHTLPSAVEALERRMIAAALEQHRGNKTQAALHLGISRRNLIRKVQAYRLDASSRSTRGR
jgi:DNA-binding NtrC family response regulator